MDHIDEAEEHKKGVGVKHTNMSKKEKYFYRVGYPENYAKAYKEDDIIY